MKQSQLVTKTRKNLSQQEISINAQLLERGGYVSKLMAGAYSYLPLGMRVLNNIETIVREEMNAIGGQEILMPALHPREIWDATERWNKVDVLFKLKGAGDKDLCLGPTHEEVVTPLIGSFIQSYKDLPRYVYQIQTKFRNEARAKSGLLRGREFRMKDLYSFHASVEDLDVYYEKAIQAYFNVFNRCGLGEKTYLTFASGGIFSKYSHEFQTLTPYGEDTIYACIQCKVAINSEILSEQSTCPQCGSTHLEEQKAIEVGNIFKLMTRFSEACNVKFTDASGSQHPVLMGCYGIGTSRLIGAIVEVSHDERGIIWPEGVAPFKTHLISLCKTEEEKAQAESLYNNLQAAGIETLFDDREGVSAGEKFADADLLGMPWRIVISSKTIAQHSVELKSRAQPTAELVQIANIISTIKTLSTKNV